MRDPSGQYFPIAEIVQVVDDGSLTAADSRRQFARSCLWILFDGAKQFVFIDRRRSTRPLLVVEARISGSEAIEPTVDSPSGYDGVLECVVDVGGCRARVAASSPFVEDDSSQLLFVDRSHLDVN